MKTTIPALSEKRQERLKQRRANFYTQSVAENNARLDAKNTIAALRDEIKFLQADLLCRASNNSG